MLISLELILFLFGGIKMALYFGYEKGGEFGVRIRVQKGRQETRVILVSKV